MLIRFESAGAELTGAAHEECAQQIACQSPARARAMRTSACDCVGCPHDARRESLPLVHDRAVENPFICQQTGSLRASLRVSDCERAR